MDRELHKKCKIRIGEPWWWALACRYFGFPKWGSVVMAFGDTIYAPRQVTAEVIVHEEVHLRQHRYSKLWAFFVFIRYNLSVKYRLACELEAYQAELDYYNVFDSQFKREDMHVRIAKSLSSSVYGPMISYDEAYKLLQMR